MRQAAAFDMVADRREEGDTAHAGSVARHVAAAVGASSPSGAVQLPLPLAER